MASNPTVLRFKKANPTYFRDWARAHPLTKEQKHKRVIANRAWRLANPDKVKAANERTKARGSRKDYLLAWKRANPDKVKEYHNTQKERIQTDPIRHQKALERSRLKYKKRNPEKLAAGRRAYRKANPDYWNQWRKRRADSDPRFDLENRIRLRMCSLVSGSRKSKKAIELLGCSLADLKTHLESLFLPGMTWENRHLWHIDHIRPCASFDLLDPEQQKCCFHYTNLQPLWAADNLRKSDKWEEAK